MSKWKKRFFSDCWERGDTTVQLLLPYDTGRAGILLYADGKLQIVTYWEGTPGGILIWRSGIAQISPVAGIPDDLTLLRFVNTVREALETSRLSLHVSEDTSEIIEWSSDDWIRQKPK